MVPFQRNRLCLLNNLEAIPPHIAMGDETLDTKIMKLAGCFENLTVQSFIYLILLITRHNTQADRGQLNIAQTARTCDMHACTVCCVHKSTPRAAIVVRLLRSTWRSVSDLHQRVSWDRSLSFILYPLFIFPADCPLRQYFL